MLSSSRKNITIIIWNTKRHSTIHKKCTDLSQIYQNPYWSQPCLNIKAPIRVLMRFNWCWMWARVEDEEWDETICGRLMSHERLQEMLLMINSWVFNQNKKMLQFSFYWHDKCFISHSTDWHCTPLHHQSSELRSRIEQKNLHLAIFGHPS